DVRRFGRNVELRAHELGSRLPELRNAGRRAIVRLVVANRFHAARARAGRAVERAVADLELHDVLALSLQRSGQGQDGESGFDAQGTSEFTQLCGHGRTLLGFKKGRTRGPFRPAVLRRRRGRTGRAAYHAVPRRLPVAFFPLLISLERARHNV